MAERDGDPVKSGQLPLDEATLQAHTGKGKSALLNSF